MLPLPASREPRHPEEPALPGLDLAWRARRRALAEACRAWGCRTPQQGGHPDLLLAADCLEEETDLRLAFQPLASWFGFPAERVASWSVQAMLRRLHYLPQQSAGPEDRYAVLVPRWEEIPPHEAWSRATYRTAAPSGELTLRLHYDPLTKAPIGALTATRADGEALLPVRSNFGPQRRDREAWWDWLFVRSLRLAHVAGCFPWSLASADALIPSGLPWGSP